ncbi:MAG TPA: hypothetical protein VFO97_07585, partial [Desertimonas sp.]|nr:hypothetical protein [Desertimonas sp.]
MGGQSADASSIRSTLSDLLPVLMPGASFEGASDEVLVPLDDGRARVNVDSLVTRSADVPAT